MWGQREREREVKIRVEYRLKDPNIFYTHDERVYLNIFALSKKIFTRIDLYAYDS